MLVEKMLEAKPNLEGTNCRSVCKVQLLKAKSLDLREKNNKENKALTMSHYPISTYLSLQCLCIFHNWLVQFSFQVLIIPWQDPLCESLLNLSFLWTQSLALTRKKWQISDTVKCPAACQLLPSGPWDSSCKDKDNCNVALQETSTLARIQHTCQVQS